MLSENIPTATFTDLYQLTMLQSYWREGMNGEAVFDLFIRRLKNRDYFVVTGIQDALREVEELSFTHEELDYIRSLDEFSDEFVNDYLRNFEFKGDVYGLPEGTIAHPNEPILQVVGPLPEAQLMETFLLNQIQHQTNVASKASMIVEAAGDRLVADFGMRRGPGAGAALKGSRAAYIAGVGATSNVSAGMKYGIPVTGTMAHSYVEAHDDEMEAFKEFATTYPNTVVLIDTYDTIEGLKKVVKLMDATDIEIGGVRLDSGDLASLSVECREILDKNGYDDVLILGSSGLDEKKIRRLDEEGNEFDGFGVGTKMMAAADQPYLDSVYKLCEYAGEGRMKLSSGKSNVPGKKQIYRNEDERVDYVATRKDDSLESEDNVSGKPLMIKMVEDGQIMRETGKVRASPIFGKEGDIPFFHDLKGIREKVLEADKVDREVQLTPELNRKYNETAERVKERA